MRGILEVDAVFSQTIGGTARNAEHRNAEVGKSGAGLTNPRMPNSQGGQIAHFCPIHLVIYRVRPYQEETPDLA